MFTYLLLHPRAIIDERIRTNRPLLGRPVRRVYQFPVERRSPREGGRR